MSQQTYNYAPIVADKDVIRTPLDVVAHVNRQLLRISSVFGGPQALDRKLVPTAITLNPAVVDLTQLTLTGNATLTLELGKTRPGHVGEIEITQDATGGWTPSFVNVLNTPTISSTANKRTLLLASRVADGWILTTLASGY